MLQEERRMEISNKGKLAMKKNERLLREELLHIFPEKYRMLLRDSLQIKNLEEIRMRIGKPLLIANGEEDWFISMDGVKTGNPANAVIVLAKDMEEVISRSCHYSPYAYQQEICEGYLTLPGGHRLGITGEVVLDKGHVLSMKYFSGINIRLAREHKGLAMPAMPFLYQEGMFQSCLVIAPPGAGKTSFLRDCVRLVSDGNAYGKGCNVGIIDERSEISACLEGEPMNDVGIRTDVLDSCPKPEGVLMLLRSMNPKVIAMDEIGGEKDLLALERIDRAGVKVLASLHGEELIDKASQERIEKIRMKYHFDRFISIQKAGKGKRKYRIYTPDYKIITEYTSEGEGDFNIELH